MPSLSRSQIVVYGAVAIALLLVGARWIRSSQAQGAPSGEISYAGAGAEASGGRDGGSLAIDAGGDDVVVHVAGAVRSPGVYRLPAGSRVTDAVERAGGAGGSAGLGAINLAARLADGQQVVVPEVASSGGGGGTVAPGAVGAAATDGPISLGTATVEQLDTIEGVGPVTAASIIEFRDQQGGLSSVEDLDQVSGIGPATMEALRSRLQP